MNTTDVPTLLARLRDRYDPPTQGIPPLCCRCGQPMTATTMMIGAYGAPFAPQFASGNWVCSMFEPDPDNPGLQRLKPGRSTAEFKPGGHWYDSQVAMPTGTPSKDPDVVALLRLVESLQEGGATLAGDPP